MKTSLSVQSARRGRRTQHSCVGTWYVGCVGNPCGTVTCVVKSSPRRFPSTYKQIIHLTWCCTSTKDTCIIEKDILNYILLISKNMNSFRYFLYVYINLCTSDVFGVICLIMCNNVNLALF